MPHMAIGEDAASAPVRTRAIRICLCLLYHVDSVWMTGDKPRLQVVWVAGGEVIHRCSAAAALYANTRQYLQLVGCVELASSGSKTTPLFVMLTRLASSSPCKISQGRKVSEQALSITPRYPSANIRRSNRPSLPRSTAPHPPGPLYHKQSVKAYHSQATGGLLVY